MRDTRVDNIKGLLIIFVVFGHVIQVVPALASWQRGGPWSLLYTGIYLFHMPAFVFISGFLSSARRTTEHAVRKTLLMYVAAQLTWVAFGFGLSFLGGARPTLTEVLCITPGWGLWYLLSLFCWRLTVPALDTCNRPEIWLFILCGVAAVLGETPANDVLSVSRTIAFLPFFAAGYWARKRVWALTERRLRPSDAVLLGATAVLAPAAALFAYRHFIPETQFAQPFSAAVGHAGLLFRLAMIVVGFGAVRVFFLLTSVRRSLISDLGRNSLSVYLGQFYLLQLLLVILPPGWWRPNMKWLAPTVTAACCVLAFLKPAALIERVRRGIDAALFGTRPAE